MSHAAQDPAILADRLWKVLQIPFIDRVLVFPVFPETDTQTVQKIGHSTAKFLEVLDMPVVVRRQVLGRDGAEHCGDFAVGVVAAPSLCNDRCLVDALVIMLDKFQQFAARERSKLCRKP